MAAVGAARQRPKWQQWANRLEFLLVSSVYGVGMHNATSLPILTLRNGGVCFLLAYAVMFVLMALPLVFLEISLGQYTSRGCLAAWHRIPIMRGVGLASLAITSLLSLYHSALLATCAHFLFASFAGTPPWSRCRDGAGGAAGCPPLDNATHGDPLADAVGVQLLTGQSPSHHYWSDTVWNASYGFAQPGPADGGLVGCLVLVWGCTFAAVAGGIGILGKVMYVTSTVPHLLFVALLLGMGMQKGALPGIEEFLAPDYGIFANYDLWTVAGREALNSVGISWGVHITMASFNVPKTNFYRDSVLVTMANMVSSLAPGVVLSAALGVLATHWSLEVSELARDGGAEILFVMFPAATALVPGSSLWSALFYLALFLQGISTQFCLALTLATAVCDERPRLARPRVAQALVVAVLTIGGFLFSLLLVTKGGLQWIIFLDYYTLLVAVPFLALMLWIGLIVIYSTGCQPTTKWQQSYCNDVREMLNRNIPCFFKICLLSVTPLLLLFLLGDTLVSFRLVHVGEPGFPEWAEVLGIPLAFLTLVCVPAYAVYRLLCKHTGSLRMRLTEATAVVEPQLNPFDDPTSASEATHHNTDEEAAHLNTDEEAAHLNTDEEAAHLNTDEEANHRNTEEAANLTTDETSV